MNETMSKSQLRRTSAQSGRPIFAASAFEHDLCLKIADRAIALAAKIGVNLNKVDVLMDVVATHVNGCPLRLDELLRSDDGTFGHDVFGIRRHIDRRTGKLMDCFSPRTALPHPSQDGDA